MGVTRPKDKLKSLSSIQLEQFWPITSLKVLALAELKQDSTFDHIPEQEVYPTIIQAIQHGEETALTFTDHKPLQQVINHLLSQGVAVRFISHHPTDRWVRAQYIKKPPCLEVYRSSLKQIQYFFEENKCFVSEEDLILLHIYHEFFHHLEEKVCGRTDDILPKVTIKKWGPVYKKQRIYQTREIAAHAFTQTALSLPWSPLVIDYLLLLNQQGNTRHQIRNYFQLLKEELQIYEDKSKTND